MAKKEELSLERLLEQALVKDEDKPYEVPENWIWTRLSNVTEIVMGQSPSGEDTTEDSSYIPLIGGASDMGYMFPDAKRYTKKPTKISKYNDIILSIRATLGRPIYADGEYCLGRGVAAIRAETIDHRYVRWLLTSIEDYLYEIASGTTFAQVSKEDLGGIPFPLPPLPEQQRVVVIIESLFEKLDCAKELIQNALDSFENRKSRILGMAIKGELTQQWRISNTGLNAEEELKVIKQGKKYKSDTNETTEFEVPDTWCWTRLGDLIELLTDYHANGSYEILKENVELLDEPDYACMIRTTNFEKENFDSLMKYISKHAYEFLSKSKLYGDEILINKIGNAGSVYLMPKLNRPASLAMNLFMLRLSQGVLPKFIYYHLTTVFSENDINQFVRGVTTKSIDKKSINSIKIAFPPLQEQKEIVRILDNLLEKVQKANELYDVIQKIDIMKKAILARAFRGELGTNDPEEESALELLKQVLHEKISKD